MRHLRCPCQAHTIQESLRADPHHRLSWVIKPPLRTDALTLPSETSCWAAALCGQECTSCCFAPSREGNSCRDQAGTCQLGLCSLLPGGGCGLWAPVCTPRARPGLAEADVWATCPSHCLREGTVLPRSAPPMVNQVDPCSCCGREQVVTGSGLDSKVLVV